MAKTMQKFVIERYKINILKESLVIVAGNPIVEAHFYEQQQDWVGAMLCPSVMKRFPELTDLLAFPPLEMRDGVEHLVNLRWPLVLSNRKSIPFHQGNMQALGLIPMPANVTSSLKDLIDSVKRTVASLTRMKMRAPDPPSQRKFDNAINFIAWLITNWDYPR